MHILYYHLYFNTRNDSSGTRSFEMASRLLRKGHMVTIVCGSREGKLQFDGEIKNGYKTGEIDGIKIIEIQIPRFNYTNFIQRAIAFLRYGFRGIKIAIQLDYDLLFATSTPLTAAIPGIVMKWFRKKPFVFEVRDLWPELPREMGVIKNPVALAAMSFLEWFSYRKADACIGLSPGIVQGIRKRSRKNQPIAMISNGCDLDVFNPGIRDELNLQGVSKNDFVAIFTGAHGIANGLEIVLDASAYLIKRGVHDIKIVFIGNGSMKPHLIERTKKMNLTNCIFLDPIPKIDLGKISGSVDVGLMVLANVPAFYYGTSPNKFFDYIASGLPVLNNYPGWLAELIKKYNCGVVVEPDNPEAFGDGLAYLVNNPDKRKIMGQNARNLAEGEFNRDIQANKFITHLETTAKLYYTRRRIEMKDRYRWHNIQR
jgi:glycosyltransferase involved in cell wall biosynthesis